MKPFKIGAILEGINPLKDGGMSVRFHTQEMPPAEKSLLMDYYQQFGWLLFAPQERELSEEDVPQESAGEYEDKTPSQRLRAAFFVLWVQKGSAGDFETWYRQQMEKVILQVKERLT